MRGTCSAQSHLASPRSESRLSRLAAGTQLPAFSQIPKSSAHTSGVWRHSHPLVSILIWDFYFDISEWHILSARAWTPALMLHLTSPCTKRKVLSLTKLKGKIYKRKSLGNYITLIVVWGAWNNPQRRGKKIGEIGTQRKNWDYPDLCSVKIDQNTKKSPGT